jgi:iron(III) transport system substrate-binding protein
VKLLRVLPALLIVAGLTWLAWPRGGPKAQGELRVVSPHWEGIREEFSSAFEEHWQQKTGESIRVVFLDLGGTGKCLQYVRSKRAGRPAVADVFFGGGVHACSGLAKKGLLQPVDIGPEARAAIPLRMGSFAIRDEKDRWFSTCLSTFGISFNRDLCRRLDLPEPKEWEDLADPRLVGWVGSGDPHYSGAIAMCYQIILETHGWEKGFELITCMAGNVRAFTEGSNGVPRDVAMGQFAAGGTIDMYALEKVHRYGKDLMGYAAPQKMPVITGDPVAVLKDAPNLKAAEEFVRFALSPAGQRLWYLQPGAKGGPRQFYLGRMPVRPALYAELKRPNPFKLAGIDRWDGRKVGRRWSISTIFLHTVLVEPHDELRVAWRALIKAGMPPEGVKEFGAPICSEDEFMALAGRYRKMKPSDQNQLIAQWGKWARKKYARVARRYAR